MDIILFLDFMEVEVVQNKLMMVNIIIIRIYTITNFQMELFGSHPDQFRMFGICGLRIIWKILFFKSFVLLHSMI